MRRISTIALRPSRFGSRCRTGCLLLSNLVGLSNGGLNDLLLVGAEVFRDVSVEVRLLLLAFCRSSVSAIFEVVTIFTQ